MNSTQARNKAINLMNEEGKELTVEFLMQQIEVEDCNVYHKNLSLLDSSTSVNFAATKGTKVMERIRDRIILEHKDLLIPVINLENPQGWRESA